MERSDSRHEWTRRGVIRAGGATVGGTLLAGASVPAAAQSDGDFDGWFDDVDNYDGVVDATGQSEVTVEVGVQNGGGAFGFGPPAVRVDPGTMVVWEWTGEGGSHNVVAEDGSFESELVAEAGHTFSHTFEERGVFEYYCEPHRSLGMKGAIVVGPAPAADGEAGSGTTGTALTDWYVLGSLALGVGAFAYAFRGAIEQRREAERVYTGEQATEAPAEEPAVELGREYDPVGTAALVAGYFLLVALLWVFMYFVEFLGGPSITG